MRFFIALEIPPQCRQQLESVQAKIKEVFPQARLTDQDKLHLTIAFVGEYAEDLKERFTQVMNTAARNIPPFEITPAYLDGFPNLHHAHVLWVGVRGDIDKLVTIRERIKDGLERMGVPADERRYIPHIAIAKIDNLNLDPQKERKMEEIMANNFQPIKISSLKLFESIPTQGFHRHNTLAEIHFKPPVSIPESKAL